MAINQAEENIAKRKSKVLKIAKVFLVVIILFTFFSKSINSWTLPEVKVQHVGSGNLVKKIKGQGIAQPKERMGHYVNVQAVVKEVKVKIGDVVQEGDLLMTLDGKELEEELQRKKLKFQVLSLEVDRLMLEKEESGIYTYEQKVKEAHEDFTYKKKVYEKHKKMYEAEAITENSFEEKKNDYESARTKYNHAKEELNIQREKETVDKKKKESELAEKRIEKQLLQSEIAKLQQDVADCSVRAICDGIVKEIGFKKGMMINGQQPVYMIDNVKKGFELHVELDRDECKYINIGDEGEVFIKGAGIPSVQANVTNICAAENMQKKKLVLDLGEASLLGEESGEVYFSKKIGQYKWVVPRSAIYTSREGDHVLVLEEKKGALGKEYYVTEQPVLIGDSDDRLTGILSGLTGREEVVTFSSKPISEGSRVDIAE